MEIKNIKIDKWDLADVIHGVKSRALRVPRFQRDFVWERSKVTKLLESIYKEFPIGSFIIWDVDEKKYNKFDRNIPERKDQIPWPTPRLF